MKKPLLLIILAVTIAFLPAKAQFDLGGVQALLQQILKENIETKTYALATKVAGEKVQQATELMKQLKVEQGNIAFRMAQMQALNSHSMLMRQQAGGKTSLLPTDGYILDSAGKLVGQNWGFIDNLMGVSGLPVSLDRDLPRSLFPLVGKQAIDIKGMAQNFLQTAGKQAIQSASDIIMGKVWQAAPMVGSTAGQAVGAAADAAKGMIGDGVFVRDYLNTKDDAYVAYAVNGSPSQKLAYYSSPLYSQTGQQYDAVRGIVSKQNAALGSVNLSNAMSAGAFQAWEQIRAKLIQANPTGTDVPKNPYEGYASLVYPEVLAAIKNAKPGESIVLTPEMIQAARNRISELDKMIPTASTQIPSIMPKNTDTSSGSTGTGGSSAGTGGFGKNAAQALQKAVMVVQPSDKDSEEFQNWMASSDKRLTENTKETKQKTEEKQILQAELKSLGKLLTESQELMRCMKPTEAIPELPQMVERVNEQIGLCKKDIVKIDKDLEELKSDLLTELKKRESYRSNFDYRQQSLAETQRNAIMMDVTSSK